MAEISWVKISTKMFDDEKIKLIRKMPEGDTIINIWIQLLIQAGKTNMNGFIMLTEKVPYSLEMLATIFDRDLSILKFAIKTLCDLGMVTLCNVTGNDVVMVTNFEKHQNTSGLEKIKEQNRLRVAKFREKQRNVTLQLHYSNATDNRDKIIDKEYIYNKQKEEFEKFWNLYDKKRGKEKAFYYWQKLTDEEKAKVFEHVPKYVKSTEKQFRKDPERYLRYKTFNDEVIDGRNKPNIKQSEYSAESIRNRFSPDELAKSKYHKPIE